MGSMGFLIYDLAKLETEPKIKEPEKIEEKIEETGTTTSETN